MPSARDRVSSEAARSSRESSAAASEYDRKAREQQQVLEEVRAQQKLLEEQRAALDAKAKLAEESLQSFSDQADSENQLYAATVERYDQSVAGKQEDFRAQLAGEVHFRVGRSLLDCDEKTLRSVEAVADGDYTANDSKLFKACLWDSLSGINGDYLPDFAMKALSCQKNSTVDEQAIRAISDSNICFSALESTQDDLANREAYQSTIQKAEEIEHHQNMVQSEQDSGVTAKSSEPPIKSEQVVVKNEEGDHEYEQTKQEENSDRASMEQIDEQSVASRSRHTSFAEFTVLEEDDRTEPSEQSVGATSVEVPSTPHSKQSKPSSSPSKKRPVEEATSDDSDTPEPAPAKKKQKTVSKTPPTALRKLTQHVEALAKAERLTEKDFQCSQCGKDMAKCENPRVAAKCQHFYCFSCITNVRKEQGTSGKGKHPEKTKCVRSGCKSIMGSMGRLERQQVQELKADHQDSLCESDDEQTTDEEDSDAEDSSQKHGEEEGSGEQSDSDSE